MKYEEGQNIYKYKYVDSEISDPPELYEFRGIEEVGVYFTNHGTVLEIIQDEKDRDYIVYQSIYGYSQDGIVGGV